MWRRAFQMLVILSSLAFLLGVAGWIQVWRSPASDNWWPLYREWHAGIEFRGVSYDSNPWDPAIFLIRVPPDVIPKTRDKLEPIPDLLTSNGGISWPRISDRRGVRLVYLLAASMVAPVVWIVMRLARREQGRGFVIVPRS